MWAEPQWEQGGGAEAVGAVIAEWAGDAADAEKLARAIDAAAGSVSEARVADAAGAVSPAQAVDARDPADAEAAPDTVDATRSRGAKRTTFSSARAYGPDSMWLMPSTAH